MVTGGRVAAIDVALGLRPADLALVGAGWWMCTAEVSTVATWRSRMTGSPWSVTSLRRLVPARVLSMSRGLVLTPGLVTPHFHQWHSNHNPTTVAQCLLQQGTTAFADGFYGPAIVAGPAAVRLLAEEFLATPLKLILLAPDPCLCAESRGRVSAGPGEPRYRRSPGDAGLADLPRAGGDLLRRAVPSERSRSASCSKWSPEPLHRARSPPATGSSRSRLHSSRPGRPPGSRTTTRASTNGGAAAPRSRAARAASPRPWVREPAGDGRWRGVGGTSAGCVRAL